MRQGAILFEIDPRPFAAALKQSQANLLKDRALLDRANEQEKRQQDLLAKNFISPDALRAGAGPTPRLRRPRSPATRRRSTARSSLEYCTIRAPVTGYVGPHPDPAG